MSSKSPADSADASHTEPEWIDSSAPDSFTVTASDIGRSIKRGREWRDEAEIEEETGRITLQPRGGDARRNSLASGDHNLLHQDPEVVDDVADRYGFLNSPAQEEAVVNQGMSTLDAVIPVLNGTLEEARDSYDSVIYATESEDMRDADRAVMERVSDGKWDIAVKRALEGEDSVLDAGGMNFTYTDRYLGDHHNKHFNAVMDMAVGRGLPESDDSTPASERNGELLLDNRLELRDPVNWKEVERLEFERREDEEPVVYDVHAEYSSGERAEQAMLYQENSTYLRGFEELESVQQHAEDSVLPVQGLAMLTPPGAYLNGLAALARMLEAQRHYVE